MKNLTPPSCSLPSLSWYSHKAKPKRSLKSCTTDKIIKKYTGNKDGLSAVSLYYVGRSYYERYEEGPRRVEYNKHLFYIISEGQEKPAITVYTTYVPGSAENGVAQIALEHLD